MVLIVAMAAMALLAIGPRRVPLWVWPAGGAVLVVLLRSESLGDAAAAVERQWNVLLFILGLMGLAVAAEESGAFAWITETLLERAGGSRRRLFVSLFLTGAVLTLALSNDATAIVLTPIVYRAVAKRGGDAMPFLFACTFVADTASFGLPFANPANVLIVPHAALLDYLLHLGPPQIAAIALNLGIFLIVFRRQLNGTYPPVRAEAPKPPAVRTLIVMACTGAVYLVAVALDWPLGLVAVAGAAGALIAAAVAPLTALRRLRWSTFVLLAGLFTLLDAVVRGGFVRWASSAIAHAGSVGNLALDAGAAAGAAVFSNLLNNLPVAIASAHLVAHSGVPHLAYPLIVGVDLGPNLTLVGSLATILWVAALRERGVRVSGRQYLMLGLAVVPPTIALTVLWLSWVR
jgi:arsenical pump membrane protein